MYILLVESFKHLSNLLHDEMMGGGGVFPLKKSAKVKGNPANNFTL